MTNPQITLLKLHEKRREFNFEIAEAVVKAFPLNSEVYFKKGRGEICAVIMQHSGCDNIKIRNIHTDKQYWIDPYWLLNQE